MATRAGVWRFDAAKRARNSATASISPPASATPTRWPGRKAGKALYARALRPRRHGKGLARTLVSAEDGAHIADEMFKVAKGTDMGWPYTYYDIAKHVRLAQPEYGGDGKTEVTDAQICRAGGGVPRPCRADGHRLL